MRNIRLRSSPSQLIGHLFRQVNRAHGTALKPTGLSPVQAQILIVLWVEGPMTVGELQRFLAMGGPALSGAIDRMEKAKLLRRRPVPGDRRAFSIEAMPYAEKDKTLVLEQLANADVQCFAALSKSERRELVRLLAKVTDGLDSSTNG